MSLCMFIVNHLIFLKGIGIDFIQHFSKTGKLKVLIAQADELHESAKVEMFHEFGEGVL